MIEEFLKQLKAGIYDTNEAHALAETSANMVNSLTVNPEKIADSILTDSLILTNTFRPFALAWIETLGEMFKNGYYDGRNEHSCMIGSRLMDIDYIKNVSKGSSNLSVLNAFCEHMQRAHKTLQQQFSSVVFYFIYKDFTRLGTITDASFSAAGLVCPDFCAVPFI